MNFTLTLGDLAAIAAIVVICVAGVRAYVSQLVLRQVRMQRQLDAIMNHLGVAEPPISRAGALSPQVASLIAVGRKIEAIRLYRQETGEGLKQAKDAVDLHVAVGPGAR